MSNAWPYQRRSEWVAEQRRTVATYFRERGVAVGRQDYILKDRDAWEHNLVDPGLRAWLIDLQQKRQASRGTFPIHKWIHHGLSSQALLVNLLGPALRAHRLDLLDIVFRDAGLQLAGEVTEVELEKEDRLVFNERQGQPTSLDLACRTSADENVFVEFKFTEPEFGGCSLFSEGDCDGANPASDHTTCYLHHIGRRYWDAMDRHGLTPTLLASPMCPLVYLYQVYREVLFALEKGGRFLLIYDARNSAFVSTGPRGVRGIWARFLDTLPAQVRAITASITIQRIAEVLEERGCEWIGALRAKHGI